MWKFSGESQNISYLVPRDPSVRCWDDRVKLEAPRTKNLLQLGLEDMESPSVLNQRVKVHLRLKPTIAVAHPYTVINDTTLETEAPKESVAFKNVNNGVRQLIHKFTFSSILNGQATQKEVFERCVSDNVKRFLAGESFLLFAYGTTNAGKTFTMQGSAEQPGVIPRALNSVFNSLKDRIETNLNYQPARANDIMAIDEQQMKKELSHKATILSLDLVKYQRHLESTTMTYRSDISSLESATISDNYVNTTFRDMQTRLSGATFDATDDKFMVWVSMVEIYNEHVFDLLEFSDERGSRTNLSYGEDEAGSPFIKNLRHVNVGSGHEAFQVFEFGRANLHLAPTVLNHSSSRSHCICTITIARLLCLDSDPKALVNRFSFCDLAGTERAKKTLNVGDRLAESKAINKSLLILGNCLAIIKENQVNKVQRMIPYRESKLTRLFRDAIIGKETLAMIVNVTTDPRLFDETSNVLKFSAIAQKIVPRVFIKPKRAQQMCQVGRTRFSRIALQSNTRRSTHTIDWCTTTITDETQPGTKDKEEQGDAYRSLLAVTNQLRAELELEKTRAARIESETRMNLSSWYRKIIKDSKDANETYVQKEKSRLERLYSRKEKRIVEYYESQLKRRREDDELKDDNPQKQMEQMEATLKELETMRLENESLRGRVGELTERVSELQVLHSKATFQLAEKTRLLELERRASRASVGEAIVKELQTQLDNERVENSKLKSLLDDAADEHAASVETVETLTRENEDLEAELLAKLEDLTDSRAEADKLRGVMCQQTEATESWEEKWERLREVLQVGGGVGVEEGVAKLVEEGAQLRDEVKFLLSKLEAQTLSTQELESEAFILKETCKSACVTQLKLETAEREVAALTEARRMWEEKSGQQAVEILNIQTEIKRLMASKQQENSTMEIASQEMQKTVEDLQKKLKQKESELEEHILDSHLFKRNLETDLETCKKKLSAAEYQSCIMRTMKDDAERKAVEIPQLKEQIELLSNEIDNKTKELEKVFENRQILFGNYEKEIKKLREENERLKKDVQFSNEVVVYNMTPRKADLVTINKLKDELRAKNEEMLKLKLERSGREDSKQVEEEINSNEDKEDEEVRSESKHIKGRSESKNVVVKETNRNESTPSEKEKEIAESVKGGDAKKQEGKDKDHRREAEMAGVTLPVLEPVVSIVKCSVSQPEGTPERLTRQIEELSIRNSEQKPKSRRKRADESVHPCLARSGRRGRGRGKTEGKENTPSKKAESSSNNKCNKKLFTDNDYDNLSELDSSFVEPPISRLRPRKN